LPNLTVVPGGGAPKPFSMSARGVAKFMIASAYAARKVVEGYAFPKDDRAPKMLPAPAKDIVWHYFRSDRDVRVLQDAIARYELVPDAETPYAKGRRRQALAVAQHLKMFAPSLAFRDVRRARDLRMQIAGVGVRASLDFVCRTADDKVTAVIVNVAEDVSDHKDRLEHYARVESELAWQITRTEMPEIEQILYIDALSERVVRTHVKSLKGEWRNIETTCDNILITYRLVIARKERKRTQEA
jgi:hypothetical protein